MTTQLDCSIGMSVAESVYGTAVAASKFFEFVDEDLDWDPTFVQGQGLRVGSRVDRAARRGLGKQQAAGGFDVEAPSKGLGALLKAALGAVTTTQRATTGVYQQNHTPLTTGPMSSYTLQKGIPPIGGGSTRALTVPGAVCSALEIDCPNSDIVTVKPTFNGREVRTDVAYAAPSYATPIELLRFLGGAVVIGGSPTAPTTTAFGTGGTAVANIVDWNLTVDNGIDDGGFNAGGAGKRSRLPELGKAAITGQLTVEYSDNTLLDALLAQTDLTLMMTVLGLTVIGSGSDVAGLQVFIPVARLEGELPKANGGEPVQMSMPFTVLDNLSAAPLTVCYASTDSAP